MVAAKPLSHGFSHHKLLLDSIHDTSQDANNRAMVSHQAKRVSERGTGPYRSPLQAQRFPGVYAAVYNLLNPGRHLNSAGL